MIFSYNWLQSFFKEKLPISEKLAELLTMKSFETTYQKSVLDIDVLPNRAPDCFSHFGVAREISAILGYKIQNTKYKIQENKKLDTKNFINIGIKGKDICPRYTARVILDVKVGPSPKWVQERLKICGLKPINNIVDIANYVMLETGQPLHAFDFDKITNKKIIIRKAKKGEKIITLDNEKYTLDKDILVIADEKEPLAIAGIKGGKKAEISKATKIVVLESANFDRLTIRQGSRKLNLRTDASLRFEHGLDPNLTEFAINRAAYLIQKITGGKITQGILDFYPRKTLPRKIRLDLDYLEKLLGVKIPEREIRKILEQLEFKILNTKYKIQNTKYILVEVPTFRLDINIPEDLIEEIGRIYGYEKIPASFPIVSLIPPKRNLDIFWEDITKNILKEAGFSEVYNYSFITEKDRKIFDDHELIEIENPTSSDFQYLRPSLIPNLLKNVQRNQKYLKEFKIFELGKIFINKQRTKNNFSFQNFPNSEMKNKKQLEKRILTSLMTGEVFYQAKGMVDLLLNKLGLANIWYDEYQARPEESGLAIWQPKKCAEIKVDGREIGFLGEISPKILEELKIENKVVVFDIDFEKLINLASEEQEYRPISRFPAAVRDIAILVPREIRVEEVLNKIETAGGKSLGDTDLFDIYEGEELPEGKKNLAFHLIYQAEDHTLTSKEIDEIHQKIIKTLEKEPDWQVRK